MLKSHVTYIIVITTLLSLLFFLASPTILSKFYFILVAILFIIMGCLKLLFLDEKSKYKLDNRLNLFEGLIAIIFPIIYLNFFNNYIICLIVASLLLIIPIIRLIVAPKFLNQFILDFFKFIGILSIYLTPKNLNRYLFLTLGSVFAFITLVILFYLIKIKKDEKHGKES